MPAAHPLDRPAWASLTSYQAKLSVGSGPARRYHRDVNVFAATGDDSPESLQSLAELIAPGEQVYLVQAPAVVLPPGFAVIKRAPCVQMLAVSQQPPTETSKSLPILTLGDDDAAEMLALATLTQPGPFRPKTHHMGTFIGLREGGQLLAMAGERMHCPGFAEVSGICTLPEARGRGHARLLASLVTARIVARGETPFLHAWATNSSAIALYETLGFRTRTVVDVAVLQRSAGSG